MRMKKIMFSILGSSILLFILMLLPLVTIQKVSVEGAIFTPKSRIEAIGKRMVGKGIGWMGMVWLISETITEHYPMIDAIKVTHAGNGHVVIHITEKKPWVSFLADGMSIPVSKDGTVLVNEDTPISWPSSEDTWIIRGFPTSYFDDPKLPQDLIQRIDRVITSITTHYHHPNMQLEYKNEDQWVLIQNDTLPIYLGSLQNMDEKFFTLKHFLNHKQTHDNKKIIKTIDLSIPYTLFVTYAS